MKDDWVLITGGTGGIGSALAKQLGAAGYRPLVGYRSRRDAAEALAGTCGGEAVALDLLDDCQIDAAVKCCTGRNLAAVILNASLAPDFEMLRKTASRSFEEQFRVSVIGNHRLLSGIIADVFKPRKAGLVVGVLSKAMGSADEPAMRQMSSYIVAKYALLGLLRAAKAEYSWLNVATVHPGYTDTPMLEAFDSRFVEMLRERNLVTSPDEAAVQIMKEMADFGPS